MKAAREFPESCRVFRSAAFVQGVAALRQLPPEDAPEIAFAGRSNSGKSSTINALTDQRSLARVSKAPGRTQEINFFSLSDATRLVDLPGYGFARVPDSVKRLWARLVEGYLVKRRCLIGLVLIVDARRGLGELDQQLLRWASTSEVAVRVLLNKSDKLKRSQSDKVLRETRKQLSGYGAGHSAQLFSAQSGDGLDELGRHVIEWISADQSRRF